MHRRALRRLLKRRNHASALKEGLTGEPGVPPCYLAAVAVVRGRELRQVSLDAGRELVAVVLRPEQPQLSLLALARTSAASLPAEAGRQPGPFGGSEDHDGAGKQNDPEPAHEPILAALLRRVEEARPRRRRR